jgi:signal peptidase
MNRVTRGLIFRPLLALACLALVAGWFFLLRPAALGGPASYVVVAGRSMEPGLRMHDLVVLRKQRAYHPGEVIAFRVPEGEVIHRIVGGDAETGFVTKGDNNEEPDLWRPTPAQIEGARWFTVPGGGHVLEFLSVPLNAAIAAGSIAAFWLLVGEEAAPLWRWRGPRIPGLTHRRRDRRSEPSQGGR